MKISKNALRLANDLGLNEVDAYLMDLKAKLYQKTSKAISNSEFTHEEIAKLVGTSRARISRLNKMGENSVSLEMLIKITALLENKAPVKVA